LIIQFISMVTKINVLAEFKKKLLIKIWSKVYEIEAVPFLKKLSTNKIEIDWKQVVSDCHEQIYAVFDELSKIPIHTPEKDFKKERQEFVNNMKYYNRNNPKVCAIWNELFPDIQSVKVCSSIVEMMGDIFNPLDEVTEIRILLNALENEDSYIQEKWVDTSGLFWYTLIGVLIK